MSRDLPLRVGWEPPEAAGRLLLSEGIASFTIERVATMAGASRMTIYKWWSSKGALALDGYLATVQAPLAFPDTGDLERDLRGQLHGFVHLLTGTSAGRVMADLIGLAQTDVDLALALRDNYTTPRRQEAVGVMARAQRRGQMRADVDPQVVVDQLWGACYHRLLIPNEPLTVGFVDALLDNVLHGIRRPTSTSRSASC